MWGMAIIDQFRAISQTKQSLKNILQKSYPEQEKYRQNGWQCARHSKGGEKLEYLLIIPGRLDNLNDYISAERANRYKGAQMKSRSEAVVINAIRQCLKRVKIDKPVYMEYRWYEKNKKRDLDNISSYGRKVIQDSLVYAHVLKNDGWKEITGFSDEFYVDAANPRIEVLIREVE
nr:MAG TPA: Endodeoxyribonuclease RusA [Caudoviricetes sp.]